MIPRSAVIVGDYRYLLERRWGTDPANKMTFIMLNPSTADADIDDPTIRRCIGIARNHGYHGIDVVNLYALRSTDPNQLRVHQDPIGPLNDLYLLRVGAGPVVAAWGAYGFATQRAVQVYDMMTSNGIELSSLGVTEAGHPRHPLYMPASAQFSRWAHKSGMPSC